MVHIGATISAPDDGFLIVLLIYHSLIPPFLPAGVSTHVAVVDAVTSRLRIHRPSLTISTRPTVMNPLPH